MNVLSRTTTRFDKREGRGGGAGEGRYGVGGKHDGGRHGEGEEGEKPGEEDADVFHGCAWFVVDGWESVVVVDVRPAAQDDKTPRMLSGAQIHGGLFLYQLIGIEKVVGVCLFFSAVERTTRLLLHLKTKRCFSISPHMMVSGMRCRISSTVG
jgi:hypothetical protein